VETNGFHGNFMGISWDFHGNFMGISFLKPQKWVFMGISWETHGF